MSDINETMLQSLGIKNYDDFENKMSSLKISEDQDPLITTYEKMENIPKPNDQITTYSEFLEHVKNIGSTNYNGIYTILYPNNLDTNKVNGGIKRKSNRKRKTKRKNRKNKRKTKRHYRK